jgi:signal transduction histidine kinase
MIGRAPLRVRVALAFALTSTVALVAIGVFVYHRMETTLVDQARRSLEAQLDALAEVPSVSRPQAVGAMTEATYGQVLGSGGSVVAASPQVAGALLPRDLLPRDEDDLFVTRAVALTDDPEPETAMVLARTADDEVLVVGTSREDISDELQTVLAQLLVGGPLLLVLATAAGYLVAGAALRPVGRMERRAALISAQHSAERLPLPAADDEVRRLGVTLNAMLDRLDMALQTERRFVAEASHELRTPLALLRTELDLALSGSRSRDELLEALRSANEEVERLTRLSEQLLPLGSTPQAPITRPVELRALSETVARRFAQTAATDDRVVSVTGTQTLVVPGDPDALDRALSNLVDNALRHGTGDVEVVAGLHDGHAVLVVSDQGGAAGSRGGSGLGLAIVRAIVEAHRGSLDIERHERGTVVTVSLPT